MATCVIVPETFDNDVSYGTNKVITVTHRLNKVEQPDLLKVRVIEFDREDEFISQMLSWFGSDLGLPLSN